MRKLFVTTAVVLMAGMAVSSAAEAGPNHVKITGQDGKARLKVKKKIPLLISCSKDCGGRLTATLVTPAGVSPDSKNFRFKAGSINRLYYRLSGYGVRLVRKNLRRSKFKVKFVVKDLDTGKRSVKRRTFKFHK